MQEERDMPFGPGEAAAAADDENKSAHTIGARWSLKRDVALYPERERKANEDDENMASR